MKKLSSSGYDECYVLWLLTLHHHYTLFEGERKSDVKIVIVFCRLAIDCDVNKPPDVVIVDADIGRNCGSCHVRTVAIHF